MGLLLLEEPGLELPPECEVVLGGPEFGGEGIPCLGRQVGEGFPTCRGAADARDGGESVVGRAKLTGGCVETEAEVEVFGSLVVEGFVCVGEESEGDPFVDGKPVQLSQVGGDVAVAGYVEDEAGGGVLNSLETFLEFSGGSCV
ncbi:hypothetical protein NDU88_004997 [Pleurodeles waltl]|uniref:Uncharacterized protein n=1 Tax=Pleurodeles waltl TaxID=8319 RepID=A0AAV7SKJ1_PLEWA|nr:hypothetical protein NDU88_004997 [Pleurodeles waltl]